MKGKDNRIWVIRAGQLSEAQNLFLNTDVMALSDPGLGDLSHIPNDRAKFQEAYEGCNPEDARPTIRAISGKFFRFIHEVRFGDLVLCPSRLDGEVYVGKVVGEYRYSPDVDERFPHQRTVTWDCSFPKSLLSVPATRELGAARTFFLLKRNSKEILDILAVHKAVKKRALRATVF